MYALDKLQTKEYLVEKERNDIQFTRPETINRWIGCVGDNKVNYRMFIMARYYVKWNK